MRKKLFLLDAMALIYRAHFAFSKNPRVNSKGLNTGAVLGFTNSLVEILEKEKPSHIAVAFDTPEPTFRHQSFEAYKAQREQQPEDITFAIPYIFKLLEAFQIPVLLKAGFEADDIVGTVAKKVVRQDKEFDVFMMTMDKDYGQLVEERIYLYKPSYLGNDVEILGVPEILAKWEITNVMQITDILGLQGDSVDNIPGIPSIGEKTAKKLIQEYGSVENLIDNVDKLKGKIQENIKNFAQQGILSKQLATIDVNVPIDFEINNLIYEGFNETKLKNLFDELEFRTLAKRLFKESSLTANKVEINTKTNSETDLFGNIIAIKENKNTNKKAISTDTTAINTNTNVINTFISDININEDDNVIVTYQNIETTHHQYYLIDTINKVKFLAKQLATLKEFCFDTETTSLETTQAELVGIAFCWYAKEAYFLALPKGETWQNILQLFKPIFEDESIIKIGQNVKYDLAILQNYGINLKGKLWDTMLAHYLLEPDMRHNMDILAKNYLQYEPVEIETLIGKKGKSQISMADAPLADVKEYACEDADVTYQLKTIFAPKIKKQGLENLLFDVETPLIEVLAAMELEGVNINVETLKEISKDLDKEIILLEQNIYQQAGETFNIASPKQLGDILFDKLKLDPKAKKTKTGQYATGEEILVKLAPEHAIINQILEYRELQKLKNTYIDALPLLISKRDARVHTSYNQAVAATGRLSSSNPNLQNIPIRTAKGREIRKAFIPRNQDYIIFSADYSQIELRIMAVFSQDKTMLQAFQAGKDIHAITASKIYKVLVEEVTAEMRRKAKTANFGIIYGISAFGLAQRLNIPRKEASELIQAYWQEFPAIKQYMEDIVNKARQKEYVETLLGRRRYLRNINSQNAVERGMAERNAINAPIQGSAADMIKLAMIHIHDFLKREKLATKMILQVHDELVFDAHKTEVTYVKQEIERLMKNALPLDVPMEIGLGVGDNWLEAH